MDVGFFIWKLSNMPKDPADLAAYCRGAGVKRLVIKILDGKWKFNVPSQTVDVPLVEYIRGLRDGGITVEGWGYHYPEQAALQGDCIMERCEKLDIRTYHLNFEGEWKQPYGMAAAAKAMLGKLKIGNEYLFCSYRYPAIHPELPWDAIMRHEAVDGASPQVYWINAHNPDAQLDETCKQYTKWIKPVYPIGCAYNTAAWFPLVSDFGRFMDAARAHKAARVYWWSMDWILTRKLQSWVTAITGQAGVIVEGPPVSDTLVINNCTWANVRSSPSSATDNRIAVIRAGQVVGNLKQSSGQWDQVSLGRITGWIHGDYTAPGN